MLFHELVQTSRRVAETSSRLAKVDLLAALLRRAAPEEIATAVAFLSSRHAGYFQGALIDIDGGWTRSL